MKNEDKNNRISQDTQQNLVIPVNRKLLRYILIIITFTFVMYWAATNTGTVIGTVEKVLTLFSPFFAGLCLAFIINTILCPFEKGWDKVFGKVRKQKIKDKLRRPVCLVLSTLLVFGAVFAIIFMLIPEIINTVSSIINMVPDVISKVDVWWGEFKELLEQYNIVLPSLDFDFSKAINTVNNLLSNYGEKFINTTVNITTTIVTFIVNLVLAVVFSIYILSQKETLGRQVKELIHAVFPRKKTDKVFDVIALANQSFSKFVVGQLLEAVIIGLLCFIGMLIFRMPYAGVISVLVGFTALIPVFGAFIGTAVGAFLILLVSPMKAVWFVVFIIVLQQIEGNLIYPKVVGKSVGLPGIWVLLAVTVGGGAFGILGMLFSVPVCSVLYVLAREFVARKNRKTDDEPKSEEAQETIETE